MPSGNTIVFCVLALSCYASLIFAQPNLTQDVVGTGLEGPELTVAQKLWYCVATAGGQYIWACLQPFSAFRRWGDSEQRSVARRGWILIQRIEGFIKRPHLATSSYFFTQEGLQIYVICSRTIPKILKLLD